MRHMAVMPEMTDTPNKAVRVKLGMNNTNIDMPDWQAFLYIEQLTATVEYLEV